MPSGDLRGDEPAHRRFEKPPDTHELIMRGAADVPRALSVVETTQWWLSDFRAMHDRDQAGHGRRRGTADE